MKQNKMSEVKLFKNTLKDDDNLTSKKTKNNAYIVKSFRLPEDLVNKLREYTQNIAPGHLKVTESDVIRYMIKNFDIDKAKEDFFKLK